MPGEPRTRVDRGIYKLGKDRYEVVVSRGWDPVKKRYGQKTERVNGTITAARAARARLLLEVDDGRHAGSDITLADVIDDWLAQLEKVERAPKTLKDYRYDADRYWIPGLGQRKVREITRAQIQDVLNDLIDQGLSTPTLRHIRACISGAMTHASRQDWIARDPTKPKLLVLPPMRSKRAIVPAPADVVVLLRAATLSERPEMSRVIWLGAVTGARNSELRALRLSDFDAAEGRLGIERAISAGKVWSTKNRQIRDNHLDDVTIAVVVEQIEWMRARAAAAGGTLDDDAYLFSEDLQGRTHWSESIVTKFFAKLADDNDLEQYTFKHLRKFMDTWGQELGFSREDVAKRAGHDPEVAWKAYTGQVAAKDRALSAAIADHLVELAGDRPAT
jgi:integrase